MAARLIDTSLWNGNWTAPPIPNYGQLLEEGVNYVIHKATEGVNPDPMFVYGMSECIRLGINWSGYHFWSQYDTTRSARAYVNLIKGHPLPAVVDFEPPDIVPVATGKKVINFIQAVEDISGQRPWIYTNYSFWNKYFPTPPTWISNYKLWMAAYPYKRTSWTAATQWDPNQYTYLTPRLPIGWTHEQMVAWQFCDKGSIPTFRSQCDLNWLFLEKF